jgi:(p)ppGpp synthase/HD superfamily hydrolase
MMTKGDFITATKDKLLGNVNLFIDSNENYTTGEKGLYKKRVQDAMVLALEIHKNQRPRPDGPYLYHILRVINRIVEEYMITDPELVIAALLHDSVEDQAEKLARHITDRMNNKKA